MDSVDTPVSKKIKINEITSSLSSSRPEASKRPHPVKRAHSESACDESPVQTVRKLPRIEFTPTSPLNDSGKENELNDTVESESVDIFSTCIPHHYHTLQDHDKDEQKALTRVKRLLSAISAVGSKSTTHSPQQQHQQQQQQQQQQIATSQRSQTLIPPLASIPISSASLSSSTTTTTVTTTPISSICPPPSSSLNGPLLDKSIPSSSAPVVSLANVASNAPTTSVDSSAVKPFTFGAPTENKPSFNFTATIPPSLVSSSTSQPAIPQFNPSTPASTLNALSTLAGNMVNPTGQFFSVGSAPSTTRKNALRLSKRRNR